MEERRINKLHGCLIEDNRVPELIQKMGSGGGLQPIELSASNDEATGNILIENMTDEIWEQLKTGNYYVKLTLPISADTIAQSYIFINSWVALDGLEAIISSSNASADIVNANMIFIKIKLTEENYSYILSSSENGYIPNLSGDVEGVSEEIMKYVAKSGSLGELNTVCVNSSWYVGIIDPIIWDGNQYITYIDSITSDFINKKYLTLGSDTLPDNQITLLLKIKIGSIYYSLSIEGNTTATLQIINDDLSITVVSFKLTMNNPNIIIEIKAVKDKTDITETFKNSITQISLYAL